jgi:hypothetical protein
MWIKPLQKPLSQAIEIRHLEYGRPFRFAKNPDEVALYMSVDDNCSSNFVSFVDMISGKIDSVPSTTMIIPKYGIFVEMTEDGQEEQTGIIKS